MKAIGKHRRTHSAFILIEVMLGVMIFAIGVIALGRCVSNCIMAETARQGAERARRALSDRMAQIEAGAIPVDKSLDEDIGDDYPGMKIKQSRKVVSAKDEKGNQILGLYEVDLEVDWSVGSNDLSKALSFYVLRTH
jgi:Tfp pilus assembly protein PilV